MIASRSAMATGLLKVIEASLARSISPSGASTHLPKVLQHLLVTRGTLGDGAVGKLIGIDPISAKVLQHAPDDAFPGSDIAGETDDVFICPFTHETPRIDCLKNFIHE